MYGFIKAVCYALCALLLFSVLILASGCGEREEPVQQAQPAPQVQQPVQAAAQQPVIVQQAPAQDNMVRDMAIGAMAGYMMGGAGQRQQAAPAPQVIERRTIVVREAPRAPVGATTPLQMPVPKQAAPVTVPTTPKPTMPQPTKPSFASTTPYKVTQSTPTYKAPPTVTYRPTPSYRPSPSYRSK